MQNSSNNKILDKLNSMQKLKNNHNFWNITWELGVILSEFVSLKNPKEILEIGTSNGFSTLWMALNLKQNSNITTIEINSDRFEIAKKNFQDTGLKNITSLNGDVFEILENYSFGNKFDFVFIDAGQKFYSDIFENLKSKVLLNENSIIIFDNINSHKHMESFIKHIEFDFKFDIININSGFLVIYFN